MSCYLVLFSVTLLICKVHSQLCSPPILPPPCPAPCVPISCDPLIPPYPVSPPQIINPNPYVTTIIDNSVSNALANALQLLIVSNLIGAAISPSTPMISNLGPLLDSLVCPNPCNVETIVPEYISYGSSYEFIPPCAPVTTCTPYYDIVPPCNPIPSCAPYYDIVPPYGVIPNCGSYYDLIPPYGPIPAYPSNYDYIPPCGPVIDTYPLPYCGLTDMISPNYFTYTETIAPIYSCIDPLPCNGYGETLYPIFGYEALGPNYCGGLTEIIPNYINYPVNELCPPVLPYYGGFAETISPTAAALPNIIGCLNEVVSPCKPLPNILAPELAFGSVIAPNYYGGLTEMPLAEMLFPSTIPAQLACNYGYTQSSLPCVRVNVEPFAYDNCLCNGYGGPFYY